jgi:N-methylhydantoinase A/oxoprolinase/acetone carboxylase beta subunit
MSSGQKDGPIGVEAQPGSNSRALVLGIDTGGTYTDGVLMDFAARQVLASHKSLTTKRDFSIGIEDVIENIHIDDPGSVRMVSISTTLATNAIAEGKGKRVALLLIGYDPELIDSFQLSKRFATPEFYYFAGGHNLHGQQKEPLDLAGLLRKVNEIKGEVDALAVSSYFSPLNPEHELEASQAISAVCDLPIVLGHQLSNRLGSVERATTAALNASLLAVLREFIISVRRSMERRQLQAPLMVVRGDGTLMSDEFAARTPVETIHSGPAASAIGGRFLSGKDDALIVDIGGTTTDLALVSAGEVTIDEEGARVGEYKTSVKAANLLSIGIGGDSHIRANSEKELLLGPERVKPLSHLAAEHRSVHTRLKALAKRSWSQSTPEWLEYWYLVQPDFDPAALKDERNRRLVELLRQGPLPLPEILQKLGLLHRNQIGAEPLMRQEIVAKSSLTPTDLLHVEGRYSPWDEEAAQGGLQVLSRYLFQEPDEVIERIWRLLTESITAAIVKFITEDRSSAPNEASSAADGWFFQNSLYGLNPLLVTSLQLRVPIIGIGAPAGLLLAPVAAALHTELILPEHFSVANAVGAVGGSVMVEEEVLVYPQLSGEGLDVIGYYVQSGGDRQVFERLEEALQSARSMGEERVISAAVRSGAENPQVHFEQLDDGIDTFRLRIKAVGNPRLSG